MLRMTKSLAHSLLWGWLMLSSITALAQKQRLAANTLAPDFSTQDVAGNPVQLSKYRGKKVLLIFFRNVGCPVCNLHAHQLLESADEFQQKGLAVLLVYESTAQHLQQYVDAQEMPFVFIPDSNKELYTQYCVGKSFWKGLGSFLFHGAVGKSTQGGRLFKKPIKQDGSMTQLTADFLINEEGKIVNAHYGRYLGDHISIATINQFVAQ